MGGDGQVEMWSSSHLLGCEPWHQLGHTVPVDGLLGTPQRAQDHIQDQDVIVIHEVVVVRGEATHVCIRQEQTISCCLKRSHGLILVNLSGY